MWELLSWLGLGTSLPFNWLGLGLVPIALLVAVLVFGGSAVLGAAGKALELAVSIAGSIWDGTVWTFKNIFGPGLANIASNGSSILTVLAVGVVLWVGADFRNARQERALADSRDYFRQEMVGFKATLQKTRQELATCKAEVRRAVRR